MIGLTIGHYKVLEELGQGRTGTVYKAQDLKRKRVVAVKVVSNEILYEPRDRTRLLHEAQTAMTLDHPNICQMLNVVEANKFIFFVMSFVAGRRLSEMVNGFPMAFDTAIDCAVQIASGLKAAHAVNIYHRDLRSQNVIITNVGGAKITDFGLGKAAEVVRLKEWESVSLSVAYMSPEQLRGGEVDQQTDLWSLAVILYEMIAGRRPFKGAEKAIMIDSIINDEPIPLSEIRSDTPAAIERFVSKSLAKNWEERHHTTDQFLVELQAMQTAMRTGDALPEPEPVPEAESKPKVELPKIPKMPPMPKMPPIPKVSLPKKPPVPKWKVFWIAAAAMVAAIAAVVFLQPGSNPPFHQGDWAVVTDFDNLTGQEDLTGALDVALSIGLAQSNHVNLITRRRAEESLTRMKMTGVRRVDATVAGEIARREGAMVIIVPAIRSAGGAYKLVYAVRHSETDDVLTTGMVEVDGREQLMEGMDQMVRDIRADLGEPESAIDRRSVSLAEAASTSVPALWNYAAALDMERHGEVEGARERYQDAVKFDGAFAVALARLGSLEYEHFDRNRGVEHVNLASDLVDKVTEPQSYYINAAKAVVVDNDPERAAQIYETAVAEYPGVATHHTRLARLYSDMGRHEDAVERYKEAIQVESTMDEALSGLATEYLEHLGRVDLALQWLRRQMSNGPQSVWPYYHLAYACIGADDLDEAAEALEYAKRLDPDFAEGLELLGHVYRLQGRYDEALAAFDRQFRADGEDVEPQYNKGVVYQHMGNDAQARDSYDRFRRIAQWRSEDNPGEASYLFDLGLVLQRLGQPEGSASAAERAAALDSTAYLEWARLRAVQGRPDDSIEMLRRAIDDGFRDLIILKYHPDFQAVRQDPRFTELLASNLKT